MELTIAAALFAGLVSFLSPCVLPVVPAYLGQLGVVAAANVPWIVTPTAGPSVDLAPRSRWAVLPHALAFVLGFGAAFTVLGLTFYALRPLFELPPVRIAGGLIVVVMGLNLMGVLRIGVLNRTFGPRREFGKPPVGGLAARSPLAALALGGVFAVAHTPCVGPTLGAILGLSIQLGAAPQVVLLLLGYSLGIGIPFIVLALAMGGSARLIRPFLRHGRTIELIGGGLVVLIGVAIVFDWLRILAQAFASLWPQV
ncbi:MAG: cytochrome c-type biosis protein [Chloroflexota bacterium]|nr:cytochrome c-type biosis protein [Chloroflexota bacterium]